MRIQKTTLAMNLHRELEQLEKALLTSMGPEARMLEVRIEAIRQRLGNPNSIAA